MYDDGVCRVIRAFLTLFRLCCLLLALFQKRCALVVWRRFVCAAAVLLPLLRVASLTPFGAIRHRAPANRRFSQSFADALTNEGGSVLYALGVPVGSSQRTVTTTGGASATLFDFR